MKIYKRNETYSQFFFKKYSFIALKSTFEFISRYKDVQESHLKQNKQFLEQTQATRLNGTPLPPADKTWEKTKNVWKWHEKVQIKHDCAKIACKLRGHFNMGCQWDTVVSWTIMWIKQGCGNSEGQIIWAILYSETLSHLSKTITPLCQFTLSYNPDKRRQVTSISVSLSSVWVLHEKIAPRV